MPKSRSATRHARRKRRTDRAPTWQGFLKSGLDGVQHLKAQLVVALERDDEARPPIAGDIGVAGERADTVEAAGLVRTAVMAAEQVGVRRKELEHLGKPARGEAVAATDAGTLLEVNGIGEALRGERFIGDRERLFQTDR